MVRRLAFCYNNCMKPFFRVDYLETKGYDWSTSHLYEHCFLASFYDFVKDKGFYPEHIGWINGGSFKDVMFFESGFYDEKVQKLLDDFIAHSPSFDDELIAHELKVMEAEALGRFNIKNPEKLRQQFLELATHEFNKSYPKIKRPSVIDFDNRPHSFTKISLRLELGTADLEIQKLFSRAVIFFTNTLDLALRAKYATYGLGESFMPYISVRNKDVVFHISVYRIDKTIWDEVGVNKFAKEVVRRIDFRAIWPAIEKHMQVLANYSSWQQHEVERYRYTGLIASNKEVAKLCTIERLEFIKNNLQIKVYKTKPSDKRWVG